jgi:hypothetical protein
MHSTFISWQVWAAWGAIIFWRKCPAGIYGTTGRRLGIPQVDPSQNLHFKSGMLA